jgi:outer membrane protein
MNEEARQKLVREISQETKSLNRESEDAQADLDQERNRIEQDLGQRIVAVIDEYAKDNGFALIFDVSSQQTSVLYANAGIDITQDIIALFDKNSRSPATSSARPVILPSAAAALAAGPQASSH